MKSYLLRKKKDAVSPVIATILMVAITVVLAAVLYVMVMGFGGGSGAQAPAVTLGKSSAGVVISISPTSDSAKIGAKVTYGTTSEYVLIKTGSTGALGATSYFNTTETNVGKVTTGDTIVLGSGTPVVTSIQLVWMPSGLTGTDKQLIGNVISF